MLLVLCGPFYEFFTSISYDCRKIDYHRIRLAVATLMYFGTAVSYVCDNGLCGPFYEYFTAISYDCSKIGFHWILVAGTLQL